MPLQLKLKTKANWDNPDETIKIIITSKTINFRNKLFILTQTNKIFVGLPFLKKMFIKRKKGPFYFFRINERMSSVVFFLYVTNYNYISPISPTSPFIPKHTIQHVGNTIVYISCPRFQWKPSSQIHKTQCCFHIHSVTASTSVFKEIERKFAKSYKEGSQHKCDTTVWCDTTNQHTHISED